MKNYIKSILFISTLIFFTSCGKDEPNPQEEALKEIQGTWNVVEVRKDQTLIPDFTGFTITFSDKSYTTLNGAPVWQSSSTFDFVDAETLDDFVRQDGRLFSASVGADGRLSIVLSYVQDPSPTARGEFGDYEFSLQAGE